MNQRMTPRMHKRLAEQSRVEIDYDKLAEAIVKAQKRAEEAKSESPKEKREALLRAISRILKGEPSADGRFLSAPFALIVSIVYRAIAIIGLFCTIVLVIGLTKMLIRTSWQGWAFLGNVLMVAVSVAALFAVILFLVLLWGAANDVEHEKDKESVISVFSGLISIAALIVAILAIRY